MFTSFNKLLANKLFKVIILIGIFIFTFILRAHNYDKEPSIGQLEEMLYGWSGIHLLAEGTPISWSTLDYPESAKIFEGEISLNGSNPKHFVDLYKPWLDEPPVYSLISGGSAYLFGASRWDILPSAYIRFPQIFISFFISIFIFLIARKVTGFWTGALAVLFYGTIPLFVFSSRLAVPENLISLIYLILIYSVLKLREKSSLLLIISVPLLIGIGGLSKPTGFLIAPLFIYELFLKKYYKSIGYTIVIIAISICAFIGYGLYYDSAIFWNIVQIQSTRPTGFGTLGYTLMSPSYDIFLFYDSFYIFCIVAFIYYVFSSFNKKEEEKAGENFLIFAGVYWLIIVAMSGGERDLLSWYRFGLFPLLPIFGVWLLKLSIKNFSFIKTFFLVSFFLGNRYLLINPFRSGISPTTFRIILSILILPSLAYEAFRKNYLKKIGQSIIVGTLIVGTYWNIVYIYNSQEIKCQSVDCPLGPSTFLSRLHYPFFWRFFILSP